MLPLLVRTRSPRVFEVNTTSLAARRRRLVSKFLYLRRRRLLEPAAVPAQVLPLAVDVDAERAKLEALEQTLQLQQEKKHGQFQQLKLVLQQQKVTPAPPIPSYDDMSLVTNEKRGVDEATASTSAAPWSLSASREVDDHRSIGGTIMGAQRYGAHQLQQQHHQHQQQWNRNRPDFAPDGGHRKKSDGGPVGGARSYMMQGTKQQQRAPWNNQQQQSGPRPFIGRYAGADGPPRWRNGPREPFRNFDPRAPRFGSHMGRGGGGMQQQQSMAPSYAPEINNRNFNNNAGRRRLPPWRQQQQQGGRGE